MTIRALTVEERLFADMQPADICENAGYYGYEYISTDKRNYLDPTVSWYDEMEATPRVYDAFDRLNKSLYCNGDAVKFCRDNGGMRIDTDNFAFLCVPIKDGIDVHLYDANKLDRHMENAKKGIPFYDCADGRCEQMFTVPDGGAVVLHNTPIGDKLLQCRYVDDGKAYIGGLYYGDMKTLCERYAQAEYIITPYTPPETKERTAAAVSKNREKERER